MVGLPTTAGVTTGGIVRGTLGLLAGIGIMQVLSSVAPRGMETDQ